MTTKTAIRQALRFRFKLGFQEIADLTKSSRQAVRMTTDPKRLLNAGTHAAKSWESRPRSERREAIRQAKQLLEKSKKP